MKNKRLAFTLVELLAVVVILGVLMMIAIPNTISLFDRNKKTNYIENAKTFVSLVQNKVQKELNNFVNTYLDNDSTVKYYKPNYSDLV